MKAPSPGESIKEVEITSWLVKNGDFVEKDQIIGEIDSDKATLEITAQESGLISIKVESGDTIPVNSIICTIDTKKNNINTTKNINLNKKLIINNNKNNYNHYKYPSPSAKKILNENNIFDYTNIYGTGKLGRITKNDVILYINNNKLKFLNYNIQEQKQKNNRLYKISKLSNLRKKISERLVAVKNETAMLTTFNEIDMTNLLIIRNKYKEIFQKKHDVNLGFMSFFTKACIRALFMYPDINAMIDGANKINFEYCDISIAVSGPKGLMVPVIRNAESYSFKDIEQEIKKFVLLIEKGNISLNDMIGGTFTITNGGIFGSMLSTPIINPPQSAILGMHKIIERPISINKIIESRPMMYVALSYDHRIIDGKDSVSFLLAIKESIENPLKYLLNDNPELTLEV